MYKMEYTAAVITISDTICKGEKTDTGGPAVCAMLEEKGWRILYRGLVPNDIGQIKNELVKCVREKKASLVLTVGGTGFSSGDVTPEATLAVVEREVRGIPEAMRAAGMRSTPRACLSRGMAGILGRSLIINLPGSEKAARENLEAVIDPIRHGVEML